MKKGRFHASLLIFLASAPCWSLNPCQEKLAKIFWRFAPITATREYKIATGMSLHNLNPNDPIVQKLSYPGWIGTRAHMGDFKFSTMSQSDFARESKALSSKGIWMTYNPSPPNSKVPSGHFSLKLRDTHFWRNIEEALFPLGELKGGDFSEIWVEEPYIVTQFFELSEPAIDALYAYHADRFIKHKTDPNYKTQYVDLPLSRNANISCGENCSTYVLSQYEQRWLEKQPGLKQAISELGSMSSSELPYRQLHYNTLSQAYRGSILIAPDLRQMESDLQSGKFNDDASGYQMFFDGPVRRNAIP